MDMDEAMNLPFVVLGGDQATWQGAYELGRMLEESFPDVDAEDLGYAIGYHGLPEGLNEVAITSVSMIQQGANDDPDWIWEIGFADGSLWTLVGWCDFTGWDCRSGADWYPKLSDT